MVCRQEADVMTSVCCICRKFSNVTMLFHFHTIILQMWYESRCESIFLSNFWELCVRIVYILHWWSKMKWKKVKSAVNNNSDDDDDDRLQTARWAQDLHRSFIRHMTFHRSAPHSVFTDYNSSSAAAVAWPRSSSSTSRGVHLFPRHLPSLTVYFRYSERRWHVLLFDR